MLDFVNLSGVYNEHNEVYRTFIQQILSEHDLLQRHCQEDHIPLKQQQEQLQKDLEEKNQGITSKF
jgi:hypothetical protein